MYAIASLLDPVSGRAVQSLWKRFEENCGMTGVKFSSSPHFTWQGADMYQIEPVEAMLRELAGQIQPFHARAASLGVFPGRMPVVYLALVKNETLLQIHQILWNRMRTFAIQPNDYYDPENWVPHITLALYDVEPDRLSCAVSSIAFQKIDLHILINNFAILYYTDGKAGMKSKFVFKEEYQPMGGSK